MKLHGGTEPRTFRIHIHQSLHKYKIKYLFSNPKVFHLYFIITKFKLATIIELHNIISVQGTKPITRGFLTKNYHLINIFSKYIVLIFCCFSLINSEIRGFMFASAVSSSQQNDLFVFVVVCGISMI